MRTRLGAERWPAILSSNPSMPILPPKKMLSPRQRVEHLIFENRSLKRTVDMLTSCREISSQLEMAPVAQTTLQVLTPLANAVSAFVISRVNDDSVFRFLATQGLTCQEAKAIADRLEPFRMTVSGPRTRMKWVQDLRGPMLVIRLSTQHAPSTSIVLTFNPQETCTDHELEKVQLVTHHASLALDNAHRYERAQNLSFTDDVTGLYNIRYLDIFLKKELDRAKRLEYPISFLFMDMDRFKQVNDRHGHLIGSGLLVLVAKELKNLIRDGDVAIRYGGDEYILVLINTSTQDATMVAERIRERIEGYPFRERLGLDENAELPELTASIGVATYPDHAKDRQAILNLADKAMYEAKKHRNAVHVAK